MRISTSHKIVFISNWKCGCSSIAGAFSPITMFGWQDRYVCEDIFGLTYDTMVHFPAGLVVQHMESAGYDAAQYDFVSSVRNPWARIVSLYNYRNERRGGSEQSFTSFVMDSLGDWRNGFINRWQSYDMFHDQGELVVENIFRLENLKAEATEWAASKGVGFVPDFSKPENTSQVVNYKDYYTNKTRDFVGEFFRWDVREFGYEY